MIGVVRKRYVTFCPSNIDQEEIDLVVQNLSDSIEEDDLLENQLRDLGIDINQLIDPDQNW